MQLRSLLSIEQERLQIELCDSGSFGSAKTLVRIQIVLRHVNDNSFDPIGKGILIAFRFIKRKREVS